MENHLFLVPTPYIWGVKSSPPKYGGEWFWNKVVQNCPFLFLGALKIEWRLKRENAAQERRRKQTLSNPLFGLPTFPHLAVQ